MYSKHFNVVALNHLTSDLKSTQIYCQSYSLRQQRVEFGKPRGQITRLCNIYIMYSTLSIKDIEKKRTIYI